MALKVSVFKGFADADWYWLIDEIRRFFHSSHYNPNSLDAKLKLTTLNKQKGARKKADELDGSVVTIAFTSLTIGARVSLLVL